MQINEALRYMGIPKEKADKQIIEKVKQAYEKLETMNPPKVLYQNLPVIKKENLVIIGSPTCQTNSKDLKALLKQCEECIVMAVTLGYEVDKEISRLQKVDVLEAMILDACASVRIDEVCDEIEQAIKKQLDEKQQLTMRFSPGYGDVPLALNKAIVTVLMASKRIGVNVTNTYMLLPSKSITAFIGIFNRDLQVEKDNVESNKATSLQKCDYCRLKDTCIYRKRGEKCDI